MEVRGKYGKLMNKGIRICYVYGPMFKKECVQIVYYTPVLINFKKERRIKSKIRIDKF